MKLLLTSMLLLCIVKSNAQSFPGYRTGNYTGVNGLMSNPANIADSRYRFDFNLISVSTSIGNDNAGFRIKDITNSFDTDELKDKFIGENSKTSNGLVIADIFGPSFMFNVGKKSAIALSTRVRAVGNVIEMDGKLVGALSDDIEDITLPYQIQSNNDMRLAVNGWSEIGLTYAREIKSFGAHYIKGGVTLKYLAGVASNYLNLERLNGTINQDNLNDEYYLANTTGRVGIGLSGLSVSDIEVEDLTEITSSGFGADLGFVYEYRPQHSTYQEMENSKGENKYKVRFSVAVLDIGKINNKQNISQSGLYDMHVTGNERFYLNELDDVDLADYTDFFNSKPQYFTPVQESIENTSFGLPSTLQLGIDYHLHRGFYVNVSGQLPLNKDSESKPFNNRLYSNVSITPRFEGKGIGFYLPVSFNDLTGMNAGAALRLGPIYFGTGSGLSALLGESKQADVFLGLKLSFLR